jgi:NitT/TauT family transport system substrate-binding protein
MNRRSFLIGGGALASGCARKPEALLDVKLAIGGAAQLVYLPTTLAQQLGLYEAEGLRVSFEDFPGGSKALQALMGGSVEVVSGFYDHTIQMAAQGKRLRAFINMLRLPGLAVVVSPKARKPMMQLDDLKGMTVGVTSPGSSTHFLLNYLLAKRNIAATEVSVVGIGHAATALAAVESGKVDAAVMAEPGLAELAARNPTIRLLADTRTPQGAEELFGTPEFPASVLYTTEDWLRKNRETARRLARAIKRTLAWIVSHTALQITQKMPREYFSGNAELYEQALVAATPIFNPNGIMTMEGAEAVRRVLAYSVPAVKEQTIDLSQTFTNDFVEME